MPSFELNDLNYIKRIIADIADETERKGHFDIAQNIRRSLLNLERKDISTYLDKDVKEISRTVKEEACGSIKIYTKTAEWFSADREAILENLQNKKVRDVTCVFANARYPYDPHIKELRDSGFKVTVYPSSLSSNIMEDQVVFYREAVLDGYPVRLAIHIHGKVGRQLAKKLGSLYNMKYDLLGQTIPRACEVIRIAIIQLKSIKEEWNYLKDCLIYTNSLNELERVLFTLYFLIIEGNIWIKIERISAITEIDDNNLYRILRNLTMDLKLIETKTSVENGEIELVKLTSEACFFIIPRILFDILNDETFLNQNPKINDIRKKYRLRWQDVGIGIDGIEVRI